MNSRHANGPDARSVRHERRSFSAEQKVAIVKRHLVDGVPVSDLCEQHDILPTQFYQWQKQLFEGGAAAFQRPRPAGTPLVDRTAAIRSSAISPRVRFPLILRLGGKWAQNRRQTQR